MTDAEYPRISVVTPIHNGIRHTLDYLNSLSHVDYPNFEVLIVDDGSTDGSAEAIALHHPRVRVLPADGTLWWAGATNLGVQTARQGGSAYVFTANNDVTLDPNIFKALLNCARSNPRTLVGTKICYMNDPHKVWHFGVYLNDVTADVHHYMGNDTDFTERRLVQALTGMGVLVPVEVFDEIGLYDAEHLPQYFADIDYCLRARYAGFKCIVDPMSIVYADVTSAWFFRELANPRLRFLWDCFMARRSPYCLAVRQVFYRRHWGPHWRRMLLMFYRRLLAHVIVREFGSLYLRTRFRALRPLVRRVRKLWQAIQ